MTDIPRKLAFIFLFSLFCVGALYIGGKLIFDSNDTINANFITAFVMWAALGASMVWKG